MKLNEAAEDLVPLAPRLGGSLKNRSQKVPEKRPRETNEDYRGEIKKLRKQLAQAQKEIQRLLNRDEGLQDLIQEFGHIAEQQDIAEEMANKKFECPHCHSHNTRLLSLRHEDSHYNCIDCGKTGPAK